MSQSTTPLPPCNGGQVKSLTIKIGTASHKIPPSSLTTASAGQLAAELAAEPPGPVVLAVGGVAGWPSEAVAGLFAVWAALRPVRAATVKLGKVTHADPLPVLFAAWAAAPDGNTTGRLKEAVDLVVNFIDPADHPAAADAVAAALADPAVSALGVLAKLTAQTKAASGSASARPNPTVLARDFLAYHRTTVTTGPVAPTDRTVHYFNGTFYLWDRRWTEQTPDEMRANVVKFLQDETDVETVTTWLVGNVLLNLQGECLVGPGAEPLPFYVDAYGPPPVASRLPILSVANGLLDFGPLAAGGVEAVLRDHTPRWFGTAATLPFAFDPKAKCKKFGQFLRQVLECPEGEPITPGDNRMRVLQEWFGYTLLPDGRFQKFLLMVGEGNNGKGVLQNLWVRMLGAENVAHVSLDQLGGRFALQPLLGKLANICGDLCEIDAVAEGVLKRLTGGDAITVDRKNQTAVTMAPNVKLVFATNTLPRFSDRSRGVWRRLMAMPFRVSVTEADQNPTLFEELKAELPGILRWAIAGLRRLLQQGHFSYCAVCAAAAHEHQSDCDPVRQFIDEVLDYLPPPGGPERRCPVDEVYGKYKTWSDTNGFKALSKNRFNRQIAKLDGVTKVRLSVCDDSGKRPYYWLGFGKPSPEAQLVAMSQEEGEDDEV